MKTKATAKKSSLPRNGTSARIPSMSSANQSGRSPHSRMLQLQQGIGNQRVAQLMRSGVIQARFGIPPVQKKGKEEEPVQKKEGVQQTPSPFSNKTGLPATLRNGLENLSGYDLSDVTVHYNSPKPARLGALAYTQGTDVHVAPGQEKHLPHEGWHVVQQMQGRVKPTIQAKGVSVNDNPSLETEADIMGEKAMNTPKPLSLSKKTPSSNGYPNVLQGVLTRAKKSEIGKCESEEEITAFLHQEIKARIDVIPNDELEQRALEYIIQWASEKRPDSVRETTKEILSSIVLFINHYQPGEGEEVAEDVAEIALNETWHANDSDGAEEETKRSDLEDGYVTNALPTPMETETVQMARNGNTVTGPKDYPTINFGTFKGVSYKTSAKGGIDFAKVHAKKTWTDPVKGNTLVELSEGMKDKSKGLTKNGSKVTIKTASRNQHFSIADRILSDKKKPVDRTGKWTWHHMETPYKMVLVDMEVHKMHGHNGGFLLW